MKKFTIEQNLKKDRLSTIFMTVLVLLVGVLCIGRVIIANHLVEDSEKLRTLDKEISEIKDKNQNLAETIRAPQSLTQIEDKAKTLGFVKSTHLTFLEPTTQVALLQ